MLGIITPIENQPGCSNADCHAHPAGQQVLGVLDTNLSLANADAQLKVSSARMLSYTAGALLIVAVLSWVFVWRVVGKPIKALKKVPNIFPREDWKGLDQAVSTKTKWVTWLVRSTT